MNDALPHSDWIAARRRDAAILSAFTLPWLASLIAIAVRLDIRHGAIITVVIFALLYGVAVTLQWRRRDAHWVVRELNLRRADMEDSADLLLAGTARSPLQQLQRERLQQRLAAEPADLRTAWPFRAVCVSLLLAVLALGAITLWPSHRATSPTSAPNTTQAAAGPIRLIAHTLHITPPAYTRLPARSETTLSIKAPQGSLLQWRLRFSSPPGHVVLALLDGRRIEFAREGDDWTAQLALDASALYRFEVAETTADTGKLHRLDALADRPPQIKVLTPEQNLTLAAPGQRSWDVAFETSDDYSVAAQATLRITLAQGSGENIRVQERSVVIHGQGEATRRRFAHRLDLAALGFALGDDVIVQLTVNDNRSPQPQSARSASLILRWQTETDSESAAIEGAVKRVLPAYFRSQRQIIIDAEALLKRKRTLDGATFMERSDAIGVDQRILRLRYGQFLGEEADGAPKLPASESDEGHDEGDGDHVHAEQAAPTTFGQDIDVVEAFGHTHDIAEAATLLDPETRATLKQALDRMWQSELELRQGQPNRALPHAYKALEFIKQVQQASRIYLARVGPQLPPIDENRRLGGKRDGLTSRPDSLRAAVTADAEIAELWRILGDAPSTITTPIDMTVLQRWLREHPSRAADPLALQAAIDTLQRQPDCVECRSELRQLLWPLLSRPPASVSRRPATDAQGRRYLDALDAQGRQ